MPKQQIAPPGAKTLGPYSPAIAVGDLVFLSGQIGLDAATGKPVEGGVTAQARQSLENLKAVLEASGSGLAHVLRTTVYLTDLSLFARMNRVYARYFDAPPAPARATVQVAALPLGSQIEVDAVAAIKRKSRPKPKAKARPRAKRASAGSRRSR